MNLNFKTITHYFALGLAGVAAFAVSPAGQSLIKQYPYLSGAFGLIVTLAALYHNPSKTAPVLILIALLFTPSAMAQTPPVPVDVPVTHVSISASFNGYDSNGKYQPANIDTFGVAIYRNAAATQGFNVNYEHVAVPSLGQRWELGLGSYWFTLPKAKGLLFDTSNFVVTVSAGAGKLLSTSDGNRFAYTVAPSVTYPIAGHMAWTVSYQYLRATGGISGLLNKSVQSVGTGPVIYF